MVKNILVPAAMGLCLLVGPALAELDIEEKAKIGLLAKTLDLTDGQRAKLTNEREKSKRKLLELEGKWQQLHNRLRQEVRKEKPDKSTIEKISADIGKVQGDIVSLRTNSLVYLKSILAPAQITIIEQGRSAE
jgi:Spy/CpxP family protein refolding chaperone